MDIFSQLSLAGIVPVIKVNDAADAAPLCQALSDGGLPVAEITFRSEAAEQAIRNVHEQMEGVLLGAGTVLSVDQVKRAVAAGATYIVSPGLNPQVVKYCVDNGIPVLPGCANPSDIEVALSLGLKTVKFFPAEALGGIKMIRAISAPYGGVRFVPTGGVNEKNALDYLNFDKVAAIGGSWMAPQDAIAQKDWARIRALTQSAVNLMLGLELSHLGVNCDSPESALRGAQAFSALLGWPVTDKGGKSIFTGSGFELMKAPLRGAHGHIAIGTNNVDRARWHLERRGFAFDDTSVSVKNGKTTAVYLREGIAGFAVHLVLK